MANKAYEGCRVCGKDLLLFKCKYCGQAFCEQHKMPDRHGCAGLAEFHRQQALGTIAKPGATEPGGAKEGNARPSTLRALVKMGVLGVKVLSVAAVIAASILGLILLVGYITASTPVYTASIPVNNANGIQVKLVNYRNATDPTYASLMAFLEADQTIRNSYVYPSYTCADFARTLHDNAEAKGIRCGLVAIDFYNATINYSIYDSGSGQFDPPAYAPDIGHALNVFDTADRGRIYVDSSAMPNFVSDGPVVRVAYIEVGKELNEIALDLADGFAYSFYEDYKARQLNLIADERAFYRDLADYSARLNATGGKETAELKLLNEQLSARAADINARKNLAGPFYFPPGIVKEYNLYW